jgi:hypothetical protein
MSMINSSGTASTNKLLERACMVGAVVTVVAVVAVVLGAGEITVTPTIGISSAGWAAHAIHLNLLGS